VGENYWYTITAIIERNPHLEVETEKNAFLMKCPTSDTWRFLIMFPNNVHHIALIFTISEVKPIVYKMCKYDRSASCKKGESACHRAPLHTPFNFVIGA